MIIERATKEDILGINHLLNQVLMVHHHGRPDLFKANVKKYTDEELEVILADDSRPVFVARINEKQIVGYAFCIMQDYENSHIMTAIKSLYIDDLCVEETIRGQHVGSQLYEYVKTYAKEQGCYNVTLNVWSCNENAMKFYEKCGMKPQKIGMEVIL